MAAFSERRPAATATSEVARRAGVAEGSIFRYYPTKKALLVAAVGVLLDAMTPVVRAGLAPVMAGDYADVGDFVRALATDRLAFERKHSALVRLFVQEIAFHPELRQRFRRTAMTVVYPMLLRAIGRMQERGLVAALPASSGARIVLSVVLGFVLARVFVAPDAPWDDEEELDAMAGVLARGLAPPRPPRALVRA